MIADLDAFMAGHAALPWAWGTVDCSIVLADWAVACGHADPAPTWRGAYADELEWKRIVVGRGGLLPLVNDVCARAGFAPGGIAARGVIGVIGAPNNVERQWGAIHDGERWQVRSTGGFVAISARVLGMWVV